MFHAVTCLLALYVIWRLVWRQRWRAPLKWALAIPILLASQHHLVTRNFFGSMASPEIPAAALMVLNWAFGSIVVAAVLLLVQDLLGLLAWPLSRRTARTLLTAPAPRAGIGVVALLLAAVGVWQAVRVPEVRSIEIQLARLPAGLDGFRIVQLTDLHASRLLQRPWMQAVVDRTRALAPDLVVLTGDMVDGTVAARTDDVEPLRELAAQHTVYAIPGNHEYYLGYRQWLEHFERLGVRMLLNEHVSIGRDSAQFVLAGVTDRAAAPFGQPMPDIDAALAGVERDAPVILLSHRPPGAQENARAGADLQLSGHTHGGQVLGLHWVTQWANDGYVSGRYQVGGMQLYVSNGAGLWPGFALRLGRASEIVQITLRSAKASEKGR
ncbi:metallophosphoesterase [Verticiella sediminum]|uniref:Metallophosphoesterase n=1 Tax=Verticiella sediminum TaxID=1247510 RepID=A0A556AYQ2_9BURK|nr:metallophosphoesterase [Verticiella sediminum]TSH98048.1 metallophosphoesterase [Verticiella sediminum]